MNITKFTFEAGLNVYLHCVRERGENIQYGNQSIDATRSVLNTKFPETPENQKHDSFPFPSDYSSTVKSFLELSRKKTGRKIAKNAKCVIGVVVTLPKQYIPPRDVDPCNWYTEDQIKKEDDFYFNTVTFLFKKFGVYYKNKGHNFLCATVHRDETTSHCHVLFIPVVKEEIVYHKRIKKGRPDTRKVTVKKGSISACEVINQQVLRSMHEELDKYLVETVEWYKGGILLSPEERLQPGQNLDIRALKKTGQKYTEKRKIANRLELLSVTEKVYKSALEELEEEGNNVSVIKLIGQLIQDKKLTEDDGKNNQIYQQALDHFKDFCRKKKTIASDLARAQKKEK